MLSFRTVFAVHLYTYYGTFFFVHYVLFHVFNCPVSELFLQGSYDDMYYTVNFLSVGMTYLIDTSSACTRTLRDDNLEPPECE
jgi:hypothetical protein